MQFFVLESKYIYLEVQKKCRREAQIREENTSLCDVRVYGFGLKRFILCLYNLLKNIYYFV